MSEGKNINLLKAAKELNIGLSTAADFLSKKGFAVEAKPMFKLEGAMYDALMKEFQGDKIVKEEDYKKIFESFLAIFGKNGISKMILRSMIPVINSELARLLEDSCRFTLDVRISEKNEIMFVMIDDETRVEKPMGSGSGYERTIASMALRAVLSKVSALPKPNVIVMDEVFGKVADDNLEMVGGFFRKIKTYFEHIFVITHNPLVKNWSDHVITINKDDNVSKIKNII